MVVVVGRVLGRVLPLVVVVVVVATTYRRAAVVVVMVVVRGKIITRIQTCFLGPILDPGQTQGYV